VGARGRIAAGLAFRRAVFRLVRQIPRGCVASYGQLAALVGRPRSARAVGRALKECPDGLPWHRVVNAQGGISARARVASMLTQRILLEQEGVAFRRGRVVLRAHRWERRRTARAWGGSG